METFRDLPVHAFESVSAWDHWLEENPTAPGIWFKFAKKASGLPTLTYVEARDTAIAHGWIDGLKFGYDDTYYLLRFTPRGKKSVWSKVNREVVERLIAEGRMRPSGLAHIDAAKTDGRWEAAYDSQSTMEVPADFQAALDAVPAAASAFAALTRSNRYAFLWRLQTARRPETRTRRIEQFVVMLAKGETLH